MTTVSTVANLEQASPANKSRLLVLNQLANKKKTAAIISYRSTKFCFVAPRKLLSSWPRTFLSLYSMASLAFLDQKPAKGKCLARKARNQVNFSFLN